MKEEEIEKLKEKYNSLLECKKERLNYIKRKEELEKTPEVMEYFKICELIKSGKNYSFYEIENLTDEEILDKALINFHSEEDNNIYTCIGEDNNSLKFRNIETLVVRNIIRENLNEFEKENIVIYPSKNFTYEEFFKMIRREYYNKIINNYSDQIAKEHASRRAYIFKRNK